MNQDELEIKDLPWLARYSYLGVFWSLVLLSFGKVVNEFLIGVIPGWNPKGQMGFVFVLIVIWLPGIVGLILGYATIIRYPYLSQVIQVGSTIRSADSLVWKLLGWLLMGIGFLMGLVGVSMSDSIGELVLLLYVSITMLFGGWYAVFFDRNKHVTVATFIDLTFGFGFAFVPVYMPALIWGSFRARKFMDELPDAKQP